VNISNSHYGIPKLKKG